MTKPYWRTNRVRYGQSIVELVVGLIVLVPIALFLVDLAVIALANQLADSFVKTTARACANQPNQGEADRVVDAAITNFKKSGHGFVTDLKAKATYTDNDRVVVHTDMDVALPVPFPFLNNTPKFQAEAVEPVVTISK